MIHSMQMALIKKDLKSITANKRMMSVLLIVPIVMTVVMPSVFVLSFLLAPDQDDGLAELLAMLPQTMRLGDVKTTMIQLLMNHIMPVFFLMIPVMAASVMAASSFVGEKEKRTLETLLYCPLSLRQIFNAKIWASFVLSMFVSLCSFVAMLVVVETELVMLMGKMIFPGISWLMAILLVSPAVALIAITLIVRGSAKAQSMEESQQRSVFLILPIILLAAGQFSGIMLVGPWLLLGLGILLMLIAVWMLRASFGRFSYESLLR